MRMKSRINLTIDADLIERAKKANMNISATMEKEIRNKLNFKEVEIDQEINKCEFCGREGIKETRETINQLENGLTWLYPDERWICNNCLQKKGRMILK